MKRESLLALSKAYIIRLKGEDAADGFFLLANHGQTARLPNDTYVVGKEHLDLLKKARVRYTEVKS